MNKHLHALINIQQKEIEDKIEYEMNETLQLDSESKKIDFEFIVDTISLLLRFIPVSFKQFILSNPSIQSKIYVCELPKSIFRNIASL